MPSSFTVSLTERMWDIIIIGAGPAGTAAALSALQENATASVLLVDRQPPGRDKTCGDGVGPDAVDILRLLDAESQVLRSEEKLNRFMLGISDGTHYEGAVSEPGYVIPRALFDERLMNLAVSRGAVFQQATCQQVRQDRTSAIAYLQTTEGEKIAVKGKVLVAADGAYSPIRRSLGIPANTGRHMSVALRGYAPTPSTLPPALHIIWDKEGTGISYMWAFPMETGTMNIGYGTTLANGPVPKAYLAERLNTLLQQENIPVALNDVKLVGHQLPLSSSVPAFAYQRILLTGDAASLINPLSGEGIVYALMSGRLAGKTTMMLDPGREYERSMRAALHRHHRQVKFLARTTHSRAVEAAIRTVKNHPQYLDSLLSMSVGTGTMTTRGAAAFAYRSIPLAFRKKNS